MTSTTGHNVPDDERALPREVREWLDQHPDAEAEDLEEAWRLARLAPPAGASFQPDPDRIAVMRSTIMTQIDKSQPAKRRPIRVLPVRRVWAVAASIVVAAAIGVLVLGQASTVTVPAGRHMEVTLSDGSNIQLNSGSTLRYSKIFGWWRRTVELRGEAFFDVTKGPKRFEVKTFNGIVTVLGTRFAVRAWPDDVVKETSVILAEGSVAFSAREEPKNPVELHEGQMSRLAGSSGRPTEPVDVDVDRLLTWRIGGLAYSAIQLGVVLSDLERKFDVEIAASDEIRSRTVSLYMSRAGSVEAVLDVLAGMHGLSWSHEGGHYELRTVNDQ